MSIKITQPFEFISRLPNFERDVINSNRFESQDPLILTEGEAIGVAGQYDIGHIVWDENKRRHYSVESKTLNGQGIVVGAFRTLEPFAVTYSDYLNSTYVPMMGEIVVVTGYKTVNGKDIPSFVVGNGTTALSGLGLSGDYAETAGTANVAKKVEHQLHIGPHDYDGSAEVTIGLYDGEYIINE